MGGMHGFGAVVTPGSNRSPSIPGSSASSRSRRSSGSTGWARPRAGRSGRRCVPPTTWPPGITSAGSGAPSSGCSGSARSRSTMSTTGWRGCATGTIRREARIRRPPDESSTRHARRRPLAPARTRGSRPGESVRVRRMRPAGHTRCPRYVRGVAGRVEAVRGVDAFPDIGPYEGPRSPCTPCHSPRTTSSAPRGEGRWTVVTDLFESYLEPV